jgi:hypothetical protein
MLDMPRRNVTRFFIPLIDVLTLLFGAFLVMPLAQPATEEGRTIPEGGHMTYEELLREHRDNSKRIRELEAELDPLKQMLNKPIQERAAIRILEIDDRTGKLYYRDQGPDRIEVANQADAQALIEHDRAEARERNRELLYVILYPRDRTSSFPLIGQLANYRAWFSKVQVRFDKPGDNL